MDSRLLMETLRSVKNIEQAFMYALVDRASKDHYFDYFELIYMRNNREKIVEEISEELLLPEKYKLSTAYTFYPPKSELCFRRMVYLPFKDLVVRYALAIVFSEYLDPMLSPLCFANRRENGERANYHFTKDFAQESWPAFCNWQEEMIKKHNVLLRTDISAFYDSICHEYMIETISDLLGIKKSSSILKLFKKILRVPIISYCSEKGKVMAKRISKQGIVIGDQSEGFFANIYLHIIDEAMAKFPCIDYGRYNDDIRIFGDDVQSVLKAIKILQENLLSRGLNLNSSKTEIADNKGDVEEMRSKMFRASINTILPEEIFGDIIFPSEKKVSSNVHNHWAKVDKSFDSFDKCFTFNEKIKSSDAKDFCKYLSNNTLLPHNERTPGHIKTLLYMLENWHGNSKFASWLLVQSAFFDSFRKETTEVAKQSIIEALQSPKVDSYGKYRIIHHLVKNRRARDKQIRIRYLFRFNESEKKILKELTRLLVKESSFELSLISLYLFRVLADTDEEVQEFINKYIPRPLSLPMKKALAYSNAIKNRSR
jgi:hypothetical protein